MLPKVDVSEALICHRQVKAPRRPQFPTLCVYTISKGAKVWNTNGSFKNRDEMAQSIKRKTKSEEFQGTILWLETWDLYYKVQRKIDGNVELRESCSPCAQQLTTDGMSKMLQKHTHCNQQQGQFIICLLKLAFAANLANPGILACQEINFMLLYR